MNEKKSTFLQGTITSAIFLLCGIGFLVTGITGYQNGSILFGVFEISWAPFFYFEPRRCQLRAANRSGVYLLALTAGFGGFIVTAGCALFLWLGLNTSVTGSQLLAHPRLYKERTVHVTGNLQTDKGECTIQVTTPGDPRFGSRTSIRLILSSPLCKTRSAREISVSASGVFDFFPRSDGNGRDYILLKATVSQTNTSS